MSRQKTTTVRFERQDRKGTFEVTATATFRRVPVTDANIADWMDLAERLLRPRTPIVTPN